VNNLLDNAAKFGRPGGTVTVAVCADREDNRAVLTVQDTGIGIAPEVLPRLFRAFEQADQGRARSRGGLGLGLAVIKQLVVLHRGEVEAASEGPGRGATFTVRLPLEREPVALLGTLHGAAPTPPRVHGRRSRVLVVEDNPDAAEGLRLLLELYGHEVRVAHTGPDGVQAASEWLPGAVVSDIGLPGFDGCEVARRIRGVPGMERALLVAVTGYGSEEDRRHVREAGFDLHLVKPADPADLQRALAARVG
jgi:two-component system CheB/CheR fusion protein